MSNFVRLQDNIVAEIIPQKATMPTIAYWYGEEFAARCVEAPDDVAQGWKYNAETKTFSDPSVLTVEQLRAAALDRICGKCSAAIFSGITVDSKHYKLTATAQTNLATAQAKIDGGATSVIYSADGEAPALYTAAQITAISAAAYEWGVVNTSYYAALQSYIAAETDADKLRVIDYGKALPDSNMQQLTALLTSAGIDITKYSGMFTA